MFFPTLKSLKKLNYAPLQVNWLEYLSSMHVNIQMILGKSFQAPNTFNALKETLKPSI